MTYFEPQAPLPLPGRVTLVEGRYLPNTGPSQSGWHDLAEAALCLQKYAGRHLLGIKQVPADYLTRGTLLHAGLGAHFLHQWAVENNQNTEQFWDPMDAVVVQARALEQGLLDVNADHDARGLVTPVQKALYAHQYHYGTRDQERYQVLGVELEMTAGILKDPQRPELGHWDLSRGVDLVVGDRMTGKVWYWDWKGRGGSSKRTEAAYENDLTLTALWKFGTKQYGDAFGGVSLNYITVPVAGKRDVNVRLDRVEAPRAPWLERDIPQTVRYYRERIADCMTLDPWLWPKAQVGGGACVDFYGKSCFMLEYCKFGPPTGGT